jgi:hypothetical protein
MKPEISNIEPAVSAAQLDAVQEELGVTFPEPYRAFLLAHNGGQPVPNTFRADGGGASLEVVGWFFAVHGREDGLASLARTYRPHLHGDLLPIASDPFGNLICLGVKGSNEGRVYFWLHESGEAPGAPIPNADCRLVAATFDQFLSSFVKA